MVRASLRLAAVVALSAGVAVAVQPGGYRLISVTGETVESGLSYEGCRVARPDLIDAVCVPPSARLIGLGCEGMAWPVYAAEESDFPTCRDIRPL